MVSSRANNNGLVIVPEVEALLNAMEKNNLGAAMLRREEEDPWDSVILFFEALVCVASSLGTAQEEQEQLQQARQQQQQQQQEHQQPEMSQLPGRMQQLLLEPSVQLLAGDPGLGRPGTEAGQDLLEIFQEMVYSLMQRQQQNAQPIQLERGARDNSDIQDNDLANSDEGGDEDEEGIYVPGFDIFNIALEDEGTIIPAGSREASATSEGNLFALYNYVMCMGVDDDVVASVVLRRPGIRQILSGVAFYNMGLSFHRDILRNGGRRQQDESRFFLMAARNYAISRLFVDVGRQLRLRDIHRGSQGDVIDTYVGDTDIVELALLNNMGHLYSHFMNHDEAKSCRSSMLQVFNRMRARGYSGSVGEDDRRFFFQSIAPFAVLGRNDDDANTSAQGHTDFPPAPAA